MRTFPVGSFNPLARYEAGGTNVSTKAGFTIMELMVVMVLLALLLSVGLPAFQNMLQGALEREVKRLGGVIRLARNEAVLSNTAFRLVIDLNGASYVIQQADGKGGFIPREDPKLFRLHKLPDDFKLQEIAIYGNTFTRERDGNAPVVIDSAGFVDPFALQFFVSGKPWTFRLQGFMAQVELHEGLVALQGEAL